MYILADTSSSDSDNVSTIYQPGTTFPQPAPSFPQPSLRRHPVIPPVVPENAGFPGPFFPQAFPHPPGFPQPQPQAFPPLHSFLTEQINLDQFQTAKCQRLDQFSYLQIYLPQLVVVWAHPVKCHPPNSQTIPNRPWKCYSCSTQPFQLRWLHYGYI
jgi:hypothetical protein